MTRVGIPNAWLVSLVASIAVSSAHADDRRKATSAPAQSSSEVQNASPGSAPSNEKALKASGDKAAKALDLCALYRELTVAPVSIERVISIVSKIPTTKGEFETSEQFEARQAEASKALKSTYIVSKVPDREYIEYDADTETMRIRGEAFENELVEYNPITFWPGPLSEGIMNWDSDPLRIYDDLDVVISQVEKNVGHYVGTTALGVSAPVDQVVRTTKSIFERRLKADPDAWKKGRSENNLFDPKRGGPVDQIKIPIKDAPKFKASVMAAFLIAPKAPFYATGVREIEPTLDTYREIEHRLSVVIADIQCALLLDKTNKVIGAYPTR